MTSPRALIEPREQPEHERLLAAAPVAYAPRLPGALVLPYARALIMEPTEHRWQVIAYVCAMIHGLGLPRQKRKRR